jgi:hypothetical protein
MSMTASPFSFLRQANCFLPFAREMRMLSRLSRIQPSLQAAGSHETSSDDQAAFGNKTGADCVH